MYSLHHPNFSAIFTHHTLISAEQFDSLSKRLSHRPGFFFSGNPSNKAQPFWFCGEASRWISLDEALRLDTPPPQSIIAGLCEYPVRDRPGQTVHAALYEWVAEATQEGDFYFHYSSSLKAEYIHELLRQSASQDIERFRLSAPFEANISREMYLSHINLILSHILKGDCYQINYTQRFQTSCEGNPWHAYRALCEHNDASHCFYFATKDQQILSFSPELFLDIQGKCVISKPIKGTRRRGASPQQDSLLKSELLASEKDRAENLMIVDLLRNDLGRVCNTGSIRVTNLFDIESYHYVHHMVSSIHGILKDEITAFEAFLSCFPGGSITGTPKIKSMEIIAQLEPTERGPYCGSFFYWLPNNEFRSNIAIRTFYTRNGIIYGHAGGAIVSDSKPEEEYEESLTKISPFIHQMEKLFYGE